MIRVRRALRLALLVVVGGVGGRGAVGCGGATPISPSAVVPPAPTPSASLATSPPSPTLSNGAVAPYDGLYLAAGQSTDTCALNGAWLVCLGPDSAVLSVSAAGRTLMPLIEGASPFTVEPPSDPNGAWTLRTPAGLALVRRNDPYLSRIHERLAGRVFVRLDSRKYSGARAIEDAYTSDTITMTDATFATVEMSDRGTKKCTRGVLFADPTWNRSIPLGPAPPPPAAGTLGMRTFMLLKLDQGCDQPIDPHTKLGVRGALGGVRLFADADGEPLGASLEGYMYAETFVARGVKREVVERVLSTATKALEHQAE